MAIMQTGEYLNAGLKLRELRQKTGLSVHKTAKKLHISGNYLSMVERGIYAPSDQVLFNIAEYFGLDTDSVFKMYDRLAPPPNELLLKMPSLKNVITEISIDENLSSEEKEKIAKQLYDIARELRRD